MGVRGETLLASKRAAGRPHEEKMTNYALNVGNMMNRAIDKSELPSAPLPTEAEDMIRSVPPPGTFNAQTVVAHVDSLPVESRDLPAPTRCAQGKFLTGNNGGGRPKGSRNRLTELLMGAIVDDFAANGATAIARLREADPATYLRMITALVPRELIMQREAQAVPDYADLTEEEALALLEAEYRRRQVEASLKAIAATVAR